jgi:hypothetical protein
MKFYRVEKRVFISLDDAMAHANRIFKKTGVVVAITEVQK